MYMTQDELREHLLKAPPGTTPGGIVKSLRAQGVIMEGDPMAQPGGPSDPYGDPFDPKLPGNSTPVISGRDIGRGITSTFPVVGGVVGAIAGGGAGLPTGPGAVAAGSAGAGAGAALGEMARKGANEMMGIGDKTTPMQDVQDIGFQGLTGALSELGGSTLLYGASKLLPKFAGGLKESAKQSIQKVLAPTTKANKYTAEKLSGEILERPVSDTFALTRKGMQTKAGVAKEAAGEAINDFGTLQGKTPVKTILDALEAEKNAFMAGGKVVDPDSVAQIESVQQIFSQYGDEIDDETMRAVRRIFDSKVAKGKGFQKTLTEGSKLDVQKTASNKIRGILAEKNPDLAKLNKEYSFWANLEDVLEATNQRTVGQDGLVTNLATIGGAVSGNGLQNTLTRALGFRLVAEAARSTGFRLASAKIKNQIADALVQGSFVKLITALEGLPVRAASQAVGQQILPPE